MKSSSTSSSRDAIRFFVRSALFILFGGMLLFAFSPGRWLSGIRSDLDLKIAGVLSHAPAVEVLGVGNSHTNAIDFNQLSNAFPAWAAGTDLFEMEYVLHSLLPRLPNLHTVLIPISYFSFYLDNTLLRRESIRVRYYEALGRLPLIPSDIPLWLRAQAAYASTDHGKGTILAALHFVGLIEDSESTGVAEIPEHTTSESLIMHAENGRVSEHLSFHQRALEEYPSIVSNTGAAIERIILLLEEREIRIVFYTPPYFFRYTELYDPAYVEETRSIMAALTDAYGVEYYDFSEDPGFIHNPDLFTNSDHMNKEGARLFTRKLSSLMQSVRIP